MKRLLIVILLTALLVVANTAFSANDRPPIARFDGSGGASFPSDLALQFSKFATIEFWVAATWDQLDYDPVVLSYLGNEGPRFAVVMAADQQGIGFMAGNQWQVAPYDFSDGKLHHVAFIVLGDETAVLIDDEYLGSLPIGIADLPVHSFNLGSLNGSDAKFVGALAGLRLWDAPLDPDEIKAFKLVNLNTPAGLKHPAINSLVAVADFAKGNLDLVLIDESFPLREERDGDDDSDLLIPDANVNQ